MRLVILSLLLSLALPASAEIYKYLDAKGNPVFSNQPPEGVPVQKVEVSPTNTVAPQPPTQTQPLKQEEPERERYSRLELTGIPGDEAVRANNGTFSVGVLIEPRLHPGHSLRLLLDGQPYGDASKAPLLQVNNVDRGEHSLAVEVMEKGQSIQRSAPVTFTVQRAHLRSPHR